VRIVAISISDKSLLKTGAYINGQWVDSDRGETLSVTNPANGEEIARVASCGTDETRRAIEAAQVAQVDWRQRSIKERSAILRKWFNLMMESQEDLAQILTAEQGFMAILFHTPLMINVWYVSSSQSVLLHVSRRGISPMPC